MYVIKHVCLDTPTRAASHISTVDCHCHAYLVAGVVHNNVVSVIMDDVDKKKFMPLFLLVILHFI